MANADNDVECDDSEAKRYLCNLIVEEKIPSATAMKPKEVCNQFLKDRPEFEPFQDYAALKFSTKLIY